MLSPESITGGERKMVGSVMFFEMETLEEVRKLIESDIYYTSEVVGLLRITSASVLISLVNSVGSREIGDCAFR